MVKIWKKYWKVILVGLVIILIISPGIKWCYDTYSHFLASKPWEYPYTKWECEELGFCYMNRSGYKDGYAEIEIDGQYYKAVLSSRHLGLLDIYLLNTNEENHIIGGWAWFSSRKCTVKAPHDYYNLLDGKDKFVLKRSDITKEEFEEFKKRVDGYQDVAANDLKERLDKKADSKMNDN